MSQDHKEASSWAARKKTVGMGSLRKRRLRSPCAETSVKARGKDQKGLIRGKYELSKALQGSSSFVFEALLNLGPANGQDWAKKDKKKKKSHY